MSTPRRAVVAFIALATVRVALAEDLEALWVSQHWEGDGGGDAARGIAADSAGNVIVVGQSNWAALTVKYTRGGTELWIRRHPGLAYGFTVDAFDNILVSLRSGTLLKYTADGELAWQVALEPDTVSEHRLVPGPQGDIYVVYGRNEDLVIVKVDRDGTVPWRRFYTLDWEAFWPRFWPFAIRLTAGGGVAIPASYNTGYLSYSAVVLEYGPEGELRRERRFGPYDPAWIGHVGRDTSGNAYLLVQLGRFGGDWMLYRYPDDEGQPTVVPLSELWPALRSPQLLIEDPYTLYLSGRDDVKEQTLTARLASNGGLIWERWLWFDADCGRSLATGPQGDTST